MRAEAVGRRLVLAEHRGRPAGGHPAQSPALHRFPVLWTRPHGVLSR
ncbi:hypothetical protein [Streptomyces erythrochromogenes]